MKKSERQNRQIKMNKSIFFKSTKVWKHFPLPTRIPWKYIFSHCFYYCKFSASSLIKCKKSRNVVLFTCFDCSTFWEGCCKLRCPSRFRTSSRTDRGRETLLRSSSSGAQKTLRTESDFQDRRLRSGIRESPGKLPCRCTSSARRSDCFGLQKTWKQIYFNCFVWC